MRVHPRLLSRPRIHRLADEVGLRVAPSLAGGAACAAANGSLSQGAIVAACLYFTGNVRRRIQFPLHLLAGGHVLLVAFQPLLGIAAAAVLLALAGGEPIGLATAGIVLAAAWLAVALGAWTIIRVRAAFPVRVALAASEAVAGDLAERLDHAGGRAHELAGWIDLGSARGVAVAPGRLGGLDAVRELVEAHRIDLIAWAPAGLAAEGDVDAETLCNRLAEECFGLPVRMLSVRQLYELLFGHVPLAMVDLAWYQHVMHPDHPASFPLTKRVFDIAAAAVCGIVALPLLACAALAIKLHDRGPVLYRQLRVGENRRSFRMLKLRTMAVDAEALGPRWADDDDPRATPVGALLRRTHIDELPQLWNVLRGEMTLVGPRPERPEMIADLAVKVPHYERRHLGRPGITGWAQVRCGYAGSDGGSAWKLSHDLFYIKRRSLVGDAVILAQTGPAIIREIREGDTTPHHLRAFDGYAVARAAGTASSLASSALDVPSVEALAQEKES